MLLLLLLLLCRYIRVTQQYFTSQGKVPPSEDFIRDYYNKARGNLMA